ncbi:MAG: hypothetical protein V1679_02055 [Candidatus Peregrinibacteria bacterium]
MKVVVTKKDGESNERSITRFNKTVQASRKILKVKADRYHLKPKTKRQERTAAVMREKYRADREKIKFH